MLYAYLLSSLLEVDVATVLMERPLQARGCVLYAANSNRAVDVAAEAKRRNNEIERSIAKNHEESSM